MNEVIRAVWLILPAYIANITACTFGGGKPLDFHRLFLDGRRLLGDGVTIRGAVAGTCFGTLICVIQSFFSQYTLPFSLKLGFLLSFGAIVGDLVESFFKRRVRMKRGSPLPFLDQLDFVVGALILSYPLLDLTVELVVMLMIITPILHFSTNYMGYKLKLKEVPW